MKRVNLILIILLLAIPCQARIICVDANGAAEFDNIQAAIDDANDGDIIEVQPGRYTENINFLGKDITLTSTNPIDEGIVDSTIIDGNDVNSVVIFSGTESSDCVLRGFTITNGEAPEGGGIYGNGTLATIENNIIIGNDGVGYGIPGSYGAGGGLLDCDGLIQNNIITENYAGSGGGAAGCDGRIKHNIISYNAWYGGGGLDFCGGEISNNLLFGNRAVYGGALSRCNGIIRNCNVVGNWATYGSGLRACNGSISNCIIWKNGAGISTQIEDCSIPVYSCIEDGSGAGTGNTSADPCFANMGYWQQQGSIWRWVENGADYHLRSQAGRWDPNSESWVQDDVNSPCIDAGDPNSDWTAELWPHGKRINMGAYGGTPQASMSLSDEGNIADLNNDDSVDYNDLKLFTDKWLNQQVLLPEDLNRNGAVDFVDFAIFGRQWSDTFVIEPGIEYQVDDCNMDAGQSSPADVESGETRFSVWVEGSYIHFEDLITANCCIDEIELLMTVEDDLVTIYEIEHLTMACTCICDYPVTATLGPFEQGNYLVEVVDVNGYSLGVVEVTIGGPSITYQIEDCNPAASGLFAAEEADQTRFSAVVEGRYIYFEDMMVANCCPDELGLEMTVEDNLITIYEIEHLTTPCLCICDFPVTATLGPFEPGTYILDVYEDWGGFIGSTVVTIGPVQ